MKAKKRRGMEAPVKVRAFINSVLSVPLENIEIVLKPFNWEYDKGDFNHWVDLFNHFDSFFEAFVKPRKDLQLDMTCLEEDPPFPKESVIQVLRVSRIILENCANKQIYSSHEHLSTLLASSDTDVVISTLSTLAAFVKRPPGKCSIRDSALSAKLFALSQGWGGKEEGLGLLVCSTADGPDPAAFRLGSTLHFEYYADDTVDQEGSGDEPKSSGLQVIHMTDLVQHTESDIYLLKQLTDINKVPYRIRFSLFTRIRFARAFSQLESRRQYICIRLLAFTVLVQASNEPNDLTAFFTNEPEFVNELVSLVRCEDVVPEDIRILAILALGALYLDRSRQSIVLSAITSGGNRGILPSLMQKAVSSITCESPTCTVSFLDALLSLMNVLVSSSSGCTALRDVGLMPTLLPILKDLDPHHIHLVTAAVHVLEAFMDYSNTTGPSFRDLGGLDSTIARLKTEVCLVEERAQQSDQATLDQKEGFQQETLVPYNRRLLMKALLRAISLGTYTPGNSTRLDGSEESALPFCLCSIFRRSKDFGGGVFALAATVMSDLIHKDPTCYPVIDAAGLATAFLDAIMAGVLPSSDAVLCIPQCLDALCLNNLGLQAITERGALKCFVKIFTSKSYLRALSGDNPGSLSTTLDELMRHAASLRGPGVDMLIEILNTLAIMGTSNDAASTLQETSTSATPMETDPVQNASTQPEGDENLKAAADRAIESSAEQSSNVETYLPECISNATRLLEHILHNNDTCGMFIEKKGIEAVLKLFDLPLLPLSFASGQNIAVAFKNFSPQHSSPLTRAVCNALKDHLKPAIEQMCFLSGKKLSEIEGASKTAILRPLASLEGVLSFSTHLLKSTATMMPELGSGGAEILKDLGVVYKEILWQISLVSSSNAADTKRENDQGTSGAQTSNGQGSEATTSETSSAPPVLRYVNPVSTRHGPTSHWSVEPEYVSVIQTAIHRHGRREHGIDGFSRIRLGRLGRQLDASDADIYGPFFPGETTQNSDSKRKSPDIEVEIMNKEASAMRAFFVTLVKVLVVPSRRRDDTGSLSPAAKSVVVSLAKVFLESLNADEGRSSCEFDSLLSTKCRYLGKVVDDMVAVIYDSRKRTCNAAVVNAFYAYGTIKRLLTTFEATGQLLWARQLMSPRDMETESSTQSSNENLDHSPLLLDTLRSYCRLLEYLVNSSLLLSVSSSSQLLVQPVSGGSVPLPGDPETFVKKLQSEVLYAILPVWNNPMFPACSPSFITSVIIIITHVYSGISDAKGSRDGTGGGMGNRIRNYAPDENAVSMMVDMGFPRARAEEALRNVESNSVEMAMEWIFNHPEEPAQEDDDLAQALALSLGNSEVAKDPSNEKGKEVQNEDRLTENPPVEDILAICMKLLQSTDAIAFPVTDLIVTLCSQNKGQYRGRVVTYLVQQLKLCKVEESDKDTNMLSTISHILALVLSEDSSSREVGAENGLVGIALELLSNFRPGNIEEGKVVVPKWVTALLLILEHMLQCKLQLSLDSQNVSGSGGPSFGTIPEDSTSEPTPEGDNGQRTMVEDNNKAGNPFAKILGKSSGYMTSEEQHKALCIACDFLQLNLPSATVQAVLQLCSRLTKSHPMAMLFLERGGLSSLLKLPRSSIFPGFDSVASVIIRHLLEDPHTLQIAMEVEIRQTLLFLYNPRVGRTSPRTFLTTLAPVISRDPAIFMQAAATVCQLQSVGGRPDIILSKEREDKEKAKEREKSKDKDRHKVVGQTESAGALDLSKGNDGAGKQSDHTGKHKGHKKIPHSFSQVIDQLLEVVLQYPPKQDSDYTGVADMDIDGATSKAKGKAKVDDFKKFEVDKSSENYTGLARVTFILKLLCDILLMYVHAINVVLKRDAEISQGRVFSSEFPGHGGILHHVLHRFLPCLGDKKSASNGEELKEKLSEKASWFLVVVCGRSSEGRRRVISEIVKALDAASNAGSSSRHAGLPNKKVLAFVDLVNSILSNNASSGNPQVPGCSPDMAKAMIEAGMVPALTSTLKVIDLDHPEAPKLVNLILKALEALTRAATSGEQIYKSEENEKKKAPTVSESDANTTSQLSSGQAQNNEAQEAQNGDQQVTNMDERQLPYQEDAQGDPSTAHENMEHDMGIETDETLEVRNGAEHGDHIITATVEVTSDLHDPTAAEMAAFRRLERRLARRSNGDMGDEDDDEDMDDEAEEEDEDEEEEEEDDIEGEEGGAHMSLADTDVEDHDEDNGLGDDYTEDVVEDEEDDDFPGSRVIEVRWREGLDGLNHVHVLGHAGGDGNLVDISAETFQVNMDDIFGFRRSAAVDRRRPTGHRPFAERQGADRGGAFQHPLLTRPVQSNGLASNGSSAFPSSGNMLRDAGVGPGGFDVTHYFYEPPFMSSDHGGSSFLADRGVGAPPPPLLDFSSEPVYFSSGRRGYLRNGRWTDDGQPQAGAQTEAIAQAIEEEFLSQLRSLTRPVEEIPTNQGAPPNSSVNNNNNNNAEDQQTTVAVMDTTGQTTSVENAQTVQVPEHQMAEAEESQPPHSAESADQREAVSASESNAAVVDVRMADEGNDTRNREYAESEGHESEGSGATMGDSLRSLEVETGSVDGREEADRQASSQVLGASASVPQPAAIIMDSGNGANDQGGTEPVSQTENAGIVQNNNIDGASGQIQGQNEAANAGNEQAEQTNNEEPMANTIDPTFLEALPEDLRAEVLASQQVQSSRPSNYAPPTSEDIDPEFLAALPPDIQAEVLAQQRAQRLAQSHQSEGQPVDMDSASIIATFPAELREEVLLTSSQAVLAALSPALLAEAQMLRERAMNQYQARSFFGGHRLGGRRHNIGSGQSGMDRGVGSGLGRRGGTTGSNSMRMKDVEGKPLVDEGALKAMLQLLRLAQPLGKGLLQRLLFNLCAHSGTRTTLVHLLLDMLKPEAEGILSDTKAAVNQRLYGCLWNMVYAGSQLSDGVPPLVTRRVLEILTYLAKHHSGVADLLFYKGPTSISSSSIQPALLSIEDKGKARLFDDELSGPLDKEIPLILLLKLLSQPLFSRSSAHLEQVMGLLEVIMNNVGLKRELETANRIAKDNSSEKESGQDATDGQRATETAGTSGSLPEASGANQETVRSSSIDKPIEAMEASTSGSKKEMTAIEILLQLPERELKNLCKLLAKEGLTETVYTKAAEVLKKLASFAPPHRKLFVLELADAARTLSGPAVNELITLAEDQCAGVSSGSLAGAAILRVLQALGTLTSVDETEDGSLVMISDLNLSLDTLWQGLSHCIGKIEIQLGNAQEVLSSSRSRSLSSSSGSASSTLPPGTQRVLPFIEAFFVLCEKLQGGSGTVQAESDDGTMSDAALAKRVGAMTFVKFAEKHRRLLNAFVRQQHGLLDKSFAMLLKMPRLIDFDNKRSFFRSRIKQQNDQHNYNPLRICVRRTYVLEDSYNQLRMRTVDDLKGRLTVQFQGEEGIDAGGLTREWYQILSRVIFDKGALLFTTVGNQSTFQPNPNSVFQTEHLSYFKFVGRVVAKALFDGQLLDVYFTRSFYKHILGAKVTYHDIEAVDPDYYKNLKWMLENDTSEVPDLTFSIDADEEKHILYEKTEVTDYELIPGGRNIRVTEENKHKYVDLVAEHKLTTAIRPQINAFLEGFNELIPKHLISIFNDKELELLISGLPEIDFDDLKASTEYTGYTAASPVIQWFWEVVQGFSKEDMARLLQFVTGTSKVPLEGFKALQGISGPQRFQIHKAYGAPERLPTAHTCFNQLDLPEYSSKDQLQERLLLAIHEASEGFGFG